MLRRFLVSNTIPKGNFAFRRKQFHGIVSASSSYDAELKMFPEYTKAKSLIKEGKFNQALPSLNFVLDVISSTTGKSSPLSVELTMQCSSLLISMGQFEKAKKLLHSNSNDLHGGQRARALLLASVSDILHGDSQGAVEQAKEATQICEKSDSGSGSGSDKAEKGWENIEKPTLLSKSYSIEGLAHLCSGDYSEAEVYLQLAARWATTPLLSNISLNNLGALMWLRDDLIGTPKKSPSATNFDTMQKKLLLPMAPKGKDSVTDESKQKHQMQHPEKIIHLAKEALNYWDEAIENANKEISVGGDGMASMCGPTSSEENGPAGPGVKAIFVSDPKMEGSSDKDASASPLKDTSSTPLDVKLQDEEFAISFAHLLCNVAEVTAFLGDDQRSIDALSSSLKVLEKHNTLACNPVLGRTLGLLGVPHIQNLQAVTAEGLFRSALEKLNSPFAINDSRSSYDRAMTTYAYGCLLKKWEKRERNGEEMMAKANQELELLRRKNKYGDGDFILQNTLQFPPLTH